MAKGTKNGPKTSGDATVVGAEADGHSSVRLYLSDGSEVIALVAGGDSFEANRGTRDRLVDALTRTIQANIPAPSA